MASVLLGLLSHFDKADLLGRRDDLDAPVGGSLIGAANKLHGNHHWGQIFCNFLCI